MPASIREAESFVALFRTIVAFLREKLQVQSVVSESTPSFLRIMQTAVKTDAKTLRGISARLHSLLNTLQLANLDQYYPLNLVADFTTLIATYSKGFTIITEPSKDTRNPDVNDPVIQLSCMDSSIAMAPVLKKYRSVVITSGTISPLHIYPKILNFRPGSPSSLRFPSLPFVFADLVRSCHRATSNVHHTQLYLSTHNHTWKRSSNLTCALLAL